ncbi:hypothetical protein QQS45_04405 [Alteriqipengyuania flavescens]|uniref:hypothetical protein n=1 Tax=Alteriqipengyuania flavescens TaxID=3053610 RepID=UPI0025B3A255|nr:hypothetical protein [Alteriqipengyuania flavescens]WJY19474.1 hypothetical protein QQW98_04400 [Alteriqipengyuania flavescens]WJY25416.1 hypothetical protein QQS45_04405 [Alteriqipengyuania flavescens]
MRKSLATLALLALAGCGSELPPNTYDLPAEEVFQRLVAGDLEEFKRARKCSIPIMFQQQAVLGKSVSWQVLGDGGQLARFGVELVPTENGASEVKIDIPSHPQGGEIHDGDKFVPYPALRQPLRPAVEELVASKVQQRPYNAQAVPRSPDDSVCDVQRGSAESGVDFRTSRSSNRGSGMADEVSDDWGE